MIVHFSLDASRRRYKPLYKRQPSIIIAVVFKNGSRDVFCKLAAPNIKIVSHKLNKPDYKWVSFN